MSTSPPNDSSKVLNERDHSQTQIRNEVRNERLGFPPVYVVVGAYRLLTDKNLYVPMWEKCKHGFVRGAIVGLGWVSVILHECGPEWY